MYIKIVENIKDWNSNIIVLGVVKHTVNYQTSVFWTLEYLAHMIMGGVKLGGFFGIFQKFGRPEYYAYMIILQ